MRIQKYLSEEKIMSRREAEKAIKGGLIKINGLIVRNLATQIDHVVDRIEIIGLLNRKATTIAFNKPRGIVSAKTKNEGETIFDLLPQFSHLNAVGRLDKESEGLILLSNDGVVTSIVTGDDHKIEKEYEVTAHESVKPRHIRKMAEGIDLEDGKTLPAKAEIIGAKSFKMILKEGRKHQIRRMASAIYLTINKLKRVRIGNIRLGDLKTGAYKILNPSDINRLKSLAKD